MKGCYNSYCWGFSSQKLTVISRLVFSEPDGYVIFLDIAVTSIL